MTDPNGLSVEQLGAANWAECGEVRRHEAATHQSRTEVQGEPTVEGDGWRPNGLVIPGFDELRELAIPAWP